MLINAKAVSFLLALCVSVITLMFLSLLNQASGVVLIVATGISFSSAFILSYVVLEFLIFKEIQKIYTSLDKVTRKELRDLRFRGFLKYRFMKSVIADSGQNSAPGQAAQNLINNEFLNKFFTTCQR